MLTRTFITLLKLKRKSFLYFWFDNRVFSNEGEAENETMEETNWGLLFTSQNAARLLAFCVLTLCRFQSMEIPIRSQRIRVRRQRSQALNAGPYTRPFNRVKVLNYITIEIQPLYKTHFCQVDDQLRPMTECVCHYPGR